jgi:hypothetical protein
MKGSVLGIPCASVKSYGNNRILLSSTFLVILPLLALFLVSAASPDQGMRLVIADSDTGRAYASWPVAEGEEFSIEFVHSVHKSPVRETFSVRGGEILPSSVRFFSFGAGMQSDLEPGQKMSREGDALVITGFSRSFRELYYIVGTVSDHLLYVQDRTISLRRLCGRNAHIRISIITA